MRLSPTQRKVLAWLASDEQWGNPGRRSSLVALRKMGLAHYSDRKGEWELTDAGRKALQESGREAG